MTDLINHPPHYVEGRNIEPIDVIDDWQLDYYLGQVLKYISRAGRKDPSKTVEDLGKAAWYLSRKISLLTGERAVEAGLTELKRNSLWPDEDGDL